MWIVVLTELIGPMECNLGGRGGSGLEIQRVITKLSPSCNLQELETRQTGSPSLPACSTRVSLIISNSPFPSTPVSTSRVKSRPSSTTLGEHLAPDSRHKGHLYLPDKPNSSRQSFSRYPADGLNIVDHHGSLRQHPEATPPSDVSFACRQQGHFGGQSMG